MRTRNDVFFFLCVIFRDKKLQVTQHALLSCQINISAQYMMKINYILLIRGIVSSIISNIIDFPCLCLSSYLQIGLAISRSKGNFNFTYITILDTFRDYSPKMPSSASLPFCNNFLMLCFPLVFLFIHFLLHFTPNFAILCALLCTLVAFCFYPNLSSQYTNPWGSTGGRKYQTSQIHNRTQQG